MGPYYSPRRMHRWVESRRVIYWTNERDALVADQIGLLALIPFVCRKRRPFRGSFARVATQRVFSVWLHVPGSAFTLVALFATVDSGRFSGSIAKKLCERMHVVTGHTSYEWSRASGSFSRPGDVVIRINLP